MIHSLLFSDFWPMIITTFMFMAIMGFIATSLEPYNPESLKSYTVFTILFTVFMGISLIIPNSLLYKYRLIFEIMIVIDIVLLILLTAFHWNK